MAAKMPKERKIIVGRGNDCDVNLNDSSVSRLHARLSIGGDASLLLADFPSRLGTYVYRGGAWQKIDALAAVAPGEPVMFGEYRTTVARLLELAEHGTKGPTTGGASGNEETRRDVVVLLADVVGYSRGMSQDPSGTLAALKSARRDVIDPLILLHGGRIFGEAGDSVCAEFGTAQHAVVAAQAIQAEINDRAFGPRQKRLKLRIGLHAGDVIVRGDNLFGSPVNIAARLQTMATAGRVCLSAEIKTRLGAASGLPLVDLGEKSLKNIPEPIHVYEIDSPGTPLEPA